MKTKDELRKEQINTVLMLKELKKEKFQHTYIRNQNPDEDDLKFLRVLRGISIIPLSLTAIIFATNPITLVAASGGITALAFSLGMFIASTINIAESYYNNELIEQAKKRLKKIPLEIDNAPNYNKIDSNNRIDKARLNDAKSIDDEIAELKKMKEVLLSKEDFEKNKVKQKRLMI